MQEKPTLSDTEVTIRGIEALQNSLGTVTTWRFLSLIHGDATNYVEVSQQIYRDQSIDEIYERAKENWKY